MMSRLPQDPRYWEMLTNQVVNEAYRNPARGWWHGIARFSIPLALSAAAAVVAALLWSPDVAKPVQGAPRATLYGFAPSDPLAGPFVTSTRAPTMATLIAIPTSGSTR